MLCADWLNRGGRDEIFLTIILNPAVGILIAGFAIFLIIDFNDKTKKGKIKPILNSPPFFSCFWVCLRDCFVVCLEYYGL